MKDLEIVLKNKVGSLALLGEVLGRNNISLEGGGVFGDGAAAIAHFLVEEGEKAKTVLAEAGIEVRTVNDVLIQKLRQGVPGQMGLFCRRLADAGVNILAQYSDHANQLIVVVDDYERGKQVSEAWTKEWAQPKQKPTGTKGQHRYSLTVKWTGNKGTGTSGYNAYERSHAVMVENKEAILGSSDPAFSGDKTKHNPEEMLVASLSSCHMLWYLHLCAEAKIIVVDYVDNATGLMVETQDGGGHFTEVVLHPLVTVTDAAMIEKANSLHAEANKRCFIANSVNFPVRHEATCVAVS